MSELAPLLMWTNPPKILDWPLERGLSQTHLAPFDCLITAGCSFTASTEWFDGAASWPGYLRDRCGIPLAIDMSYPGAGNQFIADSVLVALDKVHKLGKSNPVVIVMWSGLDRLEHLKKTDKDTQGPKLNDTVYQRILINLDKKTSTLRSRDLMLATHKHLAERSIKFAFSSYVNYLFPPFIPKRDTTNHFQDFLSNKDIESLQKLPWVPRIPMNFLYEWAFSHNHLDTGDYFHPPIEANKLWTEQVLIPGLVDLGLISAMD